MMVAVLKFEIGQGDDVQVFKAFSLDARETLVRRAWYEAHRMSNQYSVTEVEDSIWVKDVWDDAVIVRWNGVLLSYSYTVDGEDVVAFGEPVKVRVVYAPVGSAEGEKAAGNMLKALGETVEELRVGNYIALWGSDGARDLEGIGSRRLNPDGSAGEFFTAKTAFESDYTAQGRLMVDFDHGRGMTGDGADVKAPGRDDILGYVDWGTAKADERGLWVERVLNRRSAYMQFLEPLIKQGLIGSSSEPVQGAVEKGTNGEIQVWPLRRDSLTVSPMEWRMMTDNPLVAQAVKALLDGFGSEPEPDGGDAGKASGSEGADEDEFKVAAVAARMRMAEVAAVAVG